MAGAADLVPRPAGHRAAHRAGPARRGGGRLRRQRARLESSRRTWAGQGGLDDPATEAAAEDARSLAYQVARGEGKLFRLGLYLTVHGEDAEDLAGQVAGVRALADSLLLSTAPATYRSLQGWVTALPAGTDALKIRRTMDTAALAAAFPFSSPGPAPGPGRAGPAARGAVRGIRLRAGPGRLGPLGAGQPQLGHPGHLRRGQVLPGQAGDLPAALPGTECWVVDPEDEYARLAAALGGAYIHLGAPGVHLNPFDLPDPARARPDALMRRALFLHTVIAVLTGAEPAPAEKAALDTAIMAAYPPPGSAPTGGPGRGPRRCWPIWPPPCAPTAPRPPSRSPTGSCLTPAAPTRRLFSAPTTTRPAGHLIVFSLRDLPEELKAIGTLLALDATWRRVSDPPPGTAAADHRR